MLYFLKLKYLCPKKLITVRISVTIMLLIIASCLIIDTNKYINTKPHNMDTPYTEYVFKYSFIMLPFVLKTMNL